MDNYAAEASDSAARHLLHNLRNAKALRLNPLVAHLLRPDAHAGAQSFTDRVVISRVTQAVAAVLRDLAPSDGNPFDGERPTRQAEIVRRCVIGTEPYKAVACDLGISLRTLFRDLDGIRLQLVEQLPRYCPPVTSVAEASDTFGLELRHANLLRNMGRFDDALQVLERLAAQSANTLQRARAWNSTAVAFVDGGATDKAGSAASRARILLSAADGSAIDKLIAECDIDLTDAMIARVHGDTDAAFARYDHAARLSRPLMSDYPHPAVDVFVRAQAQFAVLQWLTGDVQTAAHAVESGWNALERLADPPESAHYVLLAASSLVHLVADGDIAWAIREMSAAAVLAERHGMLHDALMALGYLAGLERLHGNPQGAVETTRRTIAIARNTMTGTEFGLLCAAAAENEANVGAIDEALRLIEEGRSRVARGGSGWARLMLGEAETMLSGGRYAEAIVAAEKAADAMQRQAKSGFVGYACLIRAQAHERRGERAQALLAVREALPLIERFGKSPELVTAYELSARLTGNRGHKANATDLSRLLKG